MLRRNLHLLDDFFASNRHKKWLRPTGAQASAEAENKQKQNPTFPWGICDFYLLSGGLQAIRDFIAYLCEDIAIQ